MSESGGSNGDKILDFVNIDPDDDGRVGRCDGGKIFGNILIVGRICNFISTWNEVLQLRLINHAFQYEASKRLRKLPWATVLNTDTRIQELVRWSRKRETLKLKPYPLSKFVVHLDLRLKTLKNFGEVVGQHISRYSFHTVSTWRNRQNAVQLGDKAALLLTHSPQLTQLQVDSDRELLISKQCIDRLPIIFPSLSVIEISRSFDFRNHKPGPDSLIDLVVSRALLTKLHIPGIFTTLSLRIIKFLIHERPLNYPEIYMNHCFTVNSNDTDLVQELTHFDFRQKELCLCVHLPESRNADDVRLMEQAVNVWLGKQTKSLSNLKIKMYNPMIPMISIQLPNLMVMQNLTIKFPHRYMPPNSRPIEPFVGIPFPALQILELESYKDEFGVFETSLMPAVREINLYFPVSPLQSPSWPVAFPNLTSLHLKVVSNQDAVFRTTLSYILTHLTRLVHLDLEVKAESVRLGVPHSNWGCWNILTGKSPKPRRVHKFPFLGRKVVFDAGVLEQPLNGVYQVSSLRNMTALKTLRLFPMLRSNLDAILCMTRAGLLVSLQKLVLCLMETDKVFVTNLAGREMAAYKEGLEQVHKEVEFVTHCSTSGLMT